MGCLLASALGWWQMTLQAIPVIQGKNYSHLATNEMVCDSSCDDSFGIVQCAAGALPHFFQSSKPRQSHLSTQQAQAAFVGSSPHSPSSQFAWLEKWNTESLLEPHLVLEASRFEEMWGRCSAGSRLLTGKKINGLIKSSPSHVVFLCSDFCHPWKARRACGG